MMRRFALLLALAAALAACGGAKDTGFPGPDETPPHTESPSPTATQNGGGAGEVDVADSEFKPKDLSIKAGEKVVWTQSGSAPHTVTADDKSFDSHPECPVKPDACMEAGDEFERAFDEPGTYPYYCKLHGGPDGAGMAGTITVE